LSATPVIIEKVRQKAMLKVGVFTVMLPDMTPEEAAQAIKANGYDGVEWRVTHVPEEKRSEAPSFWGNNLCTLSPDEAQRARDIATNAGLEIPGLGTYLGVGDIPATEKAMQFAQVCGAKQIRVPSGGFGAGVSYAEQFEKARRYLAEVESMAKQYSVKGLVEIHHKTITPSASLAHRLISAFDPAYIGVIHDAGNMVHEGFEDYGLGIQLLGDYLAHVHIKNAAYDSGGVWRSRWSPLEDGVVDFDALFTALKEANYQGWLVVEDFSKARSTPEALTHNLAFLQEKLNAVYA
jgi:sugar phosphate isomerase/epimerase